MYAVVAVRANDLQATFLKLENNDLEHWLGPHRRVYQPSRINICCVPV